MKIIISPAKNMCFSGKIPLIRDEKDLQEFKDTSGVKELKKEY